MLVTLFAGKSFSQGPNDYNFCIRNVSHTSPGIIEFDVWLEWSGTNKQKFQLFQGGLNFNYDGLANGGVITGNFVPGSADPSLPAVQQIPNWNINPVSRQIRFLAAIATPVSVAAVVPASPGVKLGTFRMTNTVSFTEKAPMNFAWSFSTGTKTTTQTKEAFYLNGSTTGTGFIENKEQSGNRIMKVADSGGCRLSSNIATENLSSLSAYPNPSSGKLTVTFNTEAKSKFNLKVTDVLGNVVFSDVISTVAGENTKSLDLGNVAKGVYYLSMEVEGVNVQSIIPVVIE